MNWMTAAGCDVAAYGGDMRDLTQSPDLSCLFPTGLVVLVALLL